MDFTIHAELQTYLENNERLIWTGRPKTGIVFRPADMFLVPFSLLWCGFAIFWLATALTLGAPTYFVLFGVPFVIIGLIFVFGRFFIDAKQRENTCYGLTNDRIIIKTGIFRKSIKSIILKNISSIDYIEEKNGTGRIIIGPKTPMTMWGSGMSWWPGVKISPTLDLIQDVSMVYHKILEIQKS